MIDHEARAKALALDMICDGNPVLWARYKECPAEVAKILAYGRAVERDTIEACAKIAENEPELEGPIPEHVRKAIESLSLEEQQRVVVRATKKSIAKQCRTQGA